MTGRDERRRSLRSVYGGLFERVPWWLALILGVAAVVLGASITLKPFDSLGVLIALVAIGFVVIGISEIASAETSIARWGGIAWVAAGVAVAVWPDLTVRGLAIFVGISLLVGGVLRIVSSLRGDTDQRVISFLSGLARAVFGVLALSWPDVTLLVLSLLVGPAMILFGIGQIADAIRRRGADRVERREHQWPNWLRAVGATASLVVALGLLALSGLLHESSAEPSAFYSAPNSVPSERGALLRSEPFSTGVPDDARAWRILYTTSRDDDTPAVASAIVLVSKAVPAGPRPVIAWAHGTTGYDPKCAPSLVAKGLAAGLVPELDQVVSHGWVLVATDYVGLGTKGPHPYLIGEPSARSVLDAVLAARRFDEVDLEKRTVVWGHSQGGGAALWTGIIAPRYAPGANVIGVAALSPATRLPQIFSALRDEPVGKIMGAFALKAYSEVYPDVDFDEYIRPEAQVFARETADRCLSGPEALFSVALAGGGPDPWFSKSPSAGTFGQRLTENIPLHPIKAPLMIGQGLTDALVLPDEQKQYVAAMCAAGQRLEYRTYEGFDHVGVVADPKSPLLADLVSWTEDRLKGEPQAKGCTTVQR